VQPRQFLTSFFVTGLSFSTRCVRCCSDPRGSRSASSRRLFDSSWRFVRFGIDLAIVDCIVAMRFRARSRLFNRGDSGKLPSTWISLSTKSIESWGCNMPWLSIPDTSERVFYWDYEGRTYACDAQVLDVWNAMSCEIRAPAPEGGLLSTLHFWENPRSGACSICSFPTYLEGRARAP